VRILFDYNDCLKKGLIRKIAPSEEKARQSLNTALKWLEETEKNFSSDALRSSLLSAYLAMFHSARSILYHDSYREKSHACVARYLEPNYVGKGHLEQKWEELLDHYREIRHRDQYSFNFFTSIEEPEDTIDKSMAFVTRMQSILDEKSKIQT
jgi:uncharacterized protein (UPF0332 family)